MKTFVPGESKAERKVRKAFEKQSLPDPIFNASEKYFVVCLKWGSKYSAEYVNKLYNMVQRNLTLPYEFVCFTDDKTNINPNIRTELLPHAHITGWWNKLYFFSNRLPINGTMLFLDLDVIVFKSIDKLFTYKPDVNFCTIRDFNRQIRPNLDRINSSAFRLKVGSYSRVYDSFIKDHNTITRRYPGDQDYLYAEIKDGIFWPDEWIQSYKWEMRGRHTLGVVNGRRNFLQPGNPTILPQTSIAVFHGEPNPHQCTDQWVIDNWH